MLVGLVNNASLFKKINLEIDRFSLVWLKRTDMVSFKFSCLLDLNVMLTKVASMDKIEIICMAVVFVFC